MVFPKKLEKGDRILLIAPSSPLRVNLGVTVEKCVEAVEKLGFQAVTGESVYARTPQGYAAASIETRIADIHRGFRDDSIQGIWTVRGGSMATELLPYLDYSMITDHPKPFLGYSDITALHVVFQEKCHMVTYHAPCASGLFPDKLKEYTLDRLWKALRMEDKLRHENPPEEPVQVLNEGEACGELVGGNLTLVMALCGTPYQLNTKGKILFLEDTDEDVYRVQRMLIQLRQSGVLDDAAGILLGAFTKCENNYSPEYDSDALFRDFFREQKCPIYTHISTGHIDLNATLPLGSVCSMRDGQIDFLRAR